MQILPAASAEGSLSNFSLACSQASPLFLPSSRARAANTNIPLVVQLASWLTELTEAPVMDV